MNKNLALVSKATKTTKQNRRREKGSEESKEQVKTTIQRCKCHDTYIVVQFVVEQEGRSITLSFLIPSLSSGNNITPDGCSSQQMNLMLVMALSMTTDNSMLIR